jgi:hypothetical protein
VTELGDNFTPRTVEVPATSIETVSALPTDSHEVPGFTVIDLTYPSWEDVCGSLAPIRPEDVHLIV